MRHPSRHRVLVALLVAVFVLVAGCGGGDPLPKAQPPTIAPTPTDPGVAVDGLDPEDLDVTDDTGISPGANLSFVSPVYSVTTATQPTAPTKVQLTLDTVIPRTSSVFVVTRASASTPWTYLPARLMTDQKHVEFSTSHFSQFAVVLMDVESALATFRADVGSRLGAGVDPKVEKPECDQTDEAKEDGYSVAFTRKKKTLFWCFGLEGDKRVLKVVNRRVLPIQVSHADAPEIDAATPPKRWVAWAGLLGTKATFLAPGRTVTYDVDLEPLQRVLVGSAVDSRAQALRAFQATAGALVAAVTNLGGKGNTLKTVASLVARPQCSKVLGQGSDKMLAGCFSRRKLVATFGSEGLLLARLTGDRSTATLLRQQFKAIALEVQKDGVQNILVRRAKPDFAALVGSFSAEGRTMVINADGLVLESVTNVTDEGIKKMADLTYQLSEPRTEDGVTRAQAVVTKAKIYDRKAFRLRVPRVGDEATVKVEKGVIRSPYVKRNYCGAGAKKNACS